MFCTQSLAERVHRSDRNAACIGHNGKTGPGKAIDSDCSYTADD